MTEKTSSEKKTRIPIPEETRTHFRAARQEMRKTIETLIPEGFSEHHKVARKEMLMAWRSLLDAAIQRMDEKK